ncbi:MAG: elongation factor G [Bacillota bacterium]|nr:elongation factor G [Thermoanaerobacteraceae bacterium]
MKGYAAEKIRNVAVVGHGGTGKTSLVEALLFNTGAINRLGRVEDGTTTADYHPEEAKRGITIHTSIVPCEFEGLKLNFLDTPGYSDFIGEVKAALRVVEGALFTVCAAAGVEVQTEIIWDYTAEMPRVVFVNKLDRENANFEQVLQSLSEKFGANFVPFMVPVGAAENFRGVVDVLNGKAYLLGEKGETEGPVPEDLAGAVEKYREKIIEAAAEAEDEYVMKYLEGQELTPEEIRAGLLKGLKEAKFVPVLCGSATKNSGVRLLLSFFSQFFPAPEVQEGPLAALVFKTLADPYVGRMNFLRVFSGVLRSDSVVLNSTKQKTEKIGQVFFLRGKNQQPAESIPAGDIGVLVKLTETTTGDTLCDKDNPVVLEGIAFPEPTLSIAVEAKSQGEEDKLATALARLVEEEPTVRVAKNTETRQTIITGMGETQLDMILERFKRKFGVEVEQKPLKIPYRETIRAEAKVEGKYKKQTGGRGQYGHVWLKVEPLPDEEFRFQEEIFGGAVPNQYFPAVEKGVREAMSEGVLAGYPVTNVSVTLYDGSFHPVDSSELAFKIAASMAFKKGLQQAKPVLLEPVMEVEVLVPETFVGDVISDLNTKRGRILGMEPAGKVTRIRAMAPLAEMARYAIDLKSMTQGRGSFQMRFSSYEEVPAQIADKIIKKAQEEKAAAGEK